MADHEPAKRPLPFGRVIVLAGVAGIATGPAPAAVPPQPALQARVAAVRQALDQRAETPLVRLAQAANWNNWPKWSKWSNWANQ